MTYSLESTREGTSDIWKVRPDGSDPTDLTKNRLVNLQPEWSSDGKKILFAAQRDRNIDLYVMNSDGTGEKRLTDHPDIDSSGLWSPDGSKVLFSTTRDSPRQEIYVLDVATSSVQRITANDSEDYQPAWWPIIFWDDSLCWFTSTVKHAAGMNVCKLACVNVSPRIQDRLTFDIAVVLAYSQVEINFLPVV